MNWFTGSVRPALSLGREKPRGVARVVELPIRCTARLLRFIAQMSWDADCAGVQARWRSLEAEKIYLKCLHGRRSRQLACLVMLALLVRCAAVVWVHNYRTPIGSEYEGLATSLVSGRGYQLASFFGLTYEQPTSTIAPVYPGLMALAFMAGGTMSSSSFVLIELVQAVVGSITCIVILWIGSDVWRPSVGRIAAWAWAFYPASVYMVTQHRPMTLVVFLLCVQLAYLYRFGGKGWTRNGVLCGSVAGVLILTEPVSLLFLGPSALWLLLRRRSPLKARARSVAILVMTAGVIVLPWTLRNWQVHGKLVAVKTSFGYQLWSGNNPAATGTLRAETVSSDEVELGTLSSSEELWRRKQSISLIAETMPPELKGRLRHAKEIEVDEILRTEALKYVRANPYRFLSLTVRRMKYFWWSDPTNPVAQSVFYRWPWMVLCPLALVGLLSSWPAWKRLLPFYFVIVGFCVPYVVTVVEARFRIPIELIAVFLSAYSLSCSLMVARSWLTAEPRRS